MSTILYHTVEGNVVSERCNPLDVPELLKAGYSLTKEIDLSDEEINLSKEHSDDEIKELAKSAGIKIGRKSIKTLRKELEL